MSGPVDSSNLKDAKRNSTFSNEHEQLVFERYTYQNYKKEFDTLLNAMKDITKLTTFVVPSLENEAAEENREELRTLANIPPSSNEWMPIFGSTINKISFELASKTQTNDEGVKSTKILNAVSNYSCQAKVIILLAAFAVKYGKICLTGRLYPLTSVARAVASLRRQHSVLDSPEYFTQWQNEMARIIKKMQNLANDRVLADEQDDAGKHGAAVRLIVQCVIVCTSQMMAIMIPDERIRGVGKSPNPYQWDLCVLDKSLSKMLGEDVVDQSRPDPTVKGADLPKTRGEKATTEKKGKNQEKQHKPKGRPSKASKCF